MTVPTTAETTTTTMPTRSEMRAPWTTREKTSRPVASVPSQCSDEGGRYRAARFVAPTSCVASTSAESATSDEQGDEDEAGDG